jgi:hypothetical protein
VRKGFLKNGSTEPTGVLGSLLTFAQFCHRPEMAEPDILHLGEFHLLKVIYLPDERNIILGFAPNLLEVMAGYHLKTKAHSHMVLKGETDPSNNTATL